MMKSLLTVGLVLCCAVAQAVIINVGSFTPIFQGVEFAIGQQIPQVSGERRLEVRCMRIDLNDTNVVLFGTPHCTNSCGLDTLSQSSSNFLTHYSLQIAVNGGFSR